jgi:hypothetical protein
MIRGMALSNTWHELRQVMAELDSRNLADRQARTQHAAHVIEKLIASVYGAHLADMFLHQGEFITEYPHLRAAFVILAAIVGWFLASTVTRRMGRSHKPAIPDDGTVR